MVARKYLIQKNATASRCPPELHCFCASSHLCTEGVRIFFNREESTEIEEKTEKPGDNADTQDRKGLISGRHNDRAGQRGSRNRATVLNEIFYRLRRGTNFRNGDVIDGGNDVC